MAIRRPASSRTRLNGNTNSVPPPVQQSRPKSVMAQKNYDDAETNIKVILRCRGRSEREIQENSPSIVQIEGAKSKDLTIETSTPVSSLGMVTPPPTRTYPFDLVFGPEATQSMIYHDVVGPMLQEVLQGYNCTLFAYGQTGTGKTYTMHGDVKPTPMGNPSTHAGIIPRVLFRLFHELETSYTDFVVKISYVELYNEELRDLLGNDLPPTNNSVQPMGMAAKDAKGADGGLKIFDDAGKRGVLIQGLEEFVAKDSKSAIALLTKGSERRQIAATKFNDHSSRSHSVFAITIHIKEAGPAGDDLLKIGKLNLVDLAGSENIGRSGAENKRAREAGMINQSLLTLGRVINALVDKAQHVPYRESKLTRLLQDSLGGRTKTCVIATISSARSNLEETLSTLDYALRAKSITNKPEINQRMNRNSLLKEYVAEIEHLKADLLAAREKNGIFFSEETWNRLNAEQELRKTELMEAKKQAEIVENQMRSVRDEFDESIALLKRREEELQDTNAKLRDVENALDLREKELRKVMNTYEEEVVVCQAHRATEVSLDGIASGLKKVVTQSLRDINGLFDKLDYKGKILHSHETVVSDNEKIINTHTDSLTKKLHEFVQLSQKMTSSLQAETQQFRVSEQQALACRIQKVNEQCNIAQDLFQRIQSCDVLEEKAVTTLQREFEVTHRSFKEEISSWSTSLETTCKTLCDKAASASTQQVTALQETILALYSSVDRTVKDFQAFLKEESLSLQAMKDLAEISAHEKTSHLQQQNKILAQMLINERKDAEKAKSDLIQRISGLLGEFMQKRDESLKGSVESLRNSNAEVEVLLTATFGRQTDIHQDVIRRHTNLESGLGKSSTQVRETRDNAINVSNKTIKAIKSGKEEVKNTVSTSISAHSSWVQKRTQQMADSCASAFEEHNRTKRARLSTVNELQANSETHHSDERKLCESIIEGTEMYTSQTLAQAKEHAESTKYYSHTAVGHLDAIRQSTSNLTNNVINEVSSGNTPRKRKWQYRDEWALTKNRDELLQAWKSSTSKAHRDLNQLENIDDLDSHRDTKSESSDVDVPPPIMPLVDSRKRNQVLTRASRRVR